MVSKIIKYTIITFFSLILLSITIYVVIIIYFIYGSNCSNIINETIVFSKRQYKAVSFIKNCGATTDFSPQVSILRISDNLKNTDNGNVFIGYHSNFIDIDVNNGNELKIYHKCKKTDIFKQEEKFSNIKILYIEK